LIIALVRIRAVGRSLSLQTKRKIFQSLLFLLKDEIFAGRMMEGREERGNDIRLLVITIIQP